MSHRQTLLRCDNLARDLEEVLFWRWCRDTVNPEAVNLWIYSIGIKA